MNMINRLVERKQDWCFILRHQGWKQAIPTVAREVSQLPYRHLSFYLFSRSLLEPLPEFYPKVPLEIRALEAIDLEAIRLIDRPSEAHQCSKRLAHNQTGLVAYYDNQLAGYGWGCAHIVPELERVPIRLEKNEFLCTDVYTAPAFRGLGIQTTLSITRFKQFHQKGFSKALCYIESHNIPSLAVWQKKLDAQLIGVINFLRIGTYYRIRIGYDSTALNAAQKNLDFLIRQPNKPNHAEKNVP